MLWYIGLWAIKYYTKTDRREQRVIEQQYWSIFTENSYYFLEYYTMLYAKRSKIFPWNIRVTGLTLHNLKIIVYQTSYV